MSHYTSVPENFPSQQLLDTAATSLLGFLNPDYVYYSFTCAHALVQVTVLINREKHEIESELQHLAARAFSSYPEFRFSLFSCQYAEDALRKGNLFFLQHCTLGQFAYGTSGDGHPVYPDEAVVGLSVRRARKLFQRRTAKINSILLDFSHCLEYENFAEAFYILHRALELLFKQAAAFLTGKSFVSKIIAKQQEYLREVAPEMGKLFDLADEEESRLLALLDEQYWNFKRKRHSSGIYTTEASAIAAKVQLMKEYVHERFERAVVAIEEGLETKQSPVDPEEEGALPEKGVEMREGITVPTLDMELLPSAYAEAVTVMEIIISFLKPVVIYCFGSRKVSDSFENILESNGKQEETVHFYLLVLADSVPINVTADLSHLIRVRTQGRCKATLLAHPVKFLQGKRPEQLYFLSKVLREGTLLFDSGTNVPGLQGAAYLKRDVVFMRDYWEERCIVARSFRDAAAAVNGEGVDVVKIALYHYSLEQLCLGLIHTFLGYRPHHYALGYLFELCDLFTPLASELFPRKGFGELSLFTELARHPSKLRDALPQHAPLKDTALLAGRCINFYDKAIELGETELERLKHFTS